MKRIPKFVSQKNKIKFVKRISEFVSEMYETDSEIRFTKKKFVKWISESVSKKYETNFKFHFRKV